MRALPAPAPVLFRVWQGGGWKDHLATRTTYLPDPGDHLELGGGQCVRVRHVGADVSVGNEQVVVWGRLVACPPR